MMRRLFLLLSALVALGALLPGGAFAQDPTPQAETEPPPEIVAVAAPARTDVRYVLPFGPEGLHPDLAQSASVRGVCGFASLSSGRPDAWDCLGVDNQVYDPCFENPYAPADAPGELACLASPFAADVVLLTLDDPLVREKDDLSQGAGDPWDLPWAVELFNGERCTLLAGSVVVVAGQAVHYACSDGGAILGMVDRRMPVWTVHYLPAGALESTLSDVVIAWS